MTLPKSVKVRSTCNACQQAKIRCSHEKPSCRRCQKHNIDCVYSISRRLGRPAKKRDHDEKKRKPKKEIVEDHEIDFNTDSWFHDYITDVPNTSSSFLNSGSSSSSRSNSSRNSHNPLDTPISPSMISAPGTTILDRTDPALPSSSYHAQSFYQTSPETFDMSLLSMDMDTTTSPADTVPSISTPVSPQQPPLPGTFINTPPLGIQAQPQPPPVPSQISLRPLEYEYPFPDTTGIDLETYTPTPQSLAPPPLPTCHCQCHEQTLHEVIRLNMMLCATLRISSPSLTGLGLGLGSGSGSGSGSGLGPAGVNVNMNMGVSVGMEMDGLGTSTLDIILNIQCGLQNLTEVILQCTLCAENRATLLTIVVVNIDALVGVVDRVAVVLLDDKYTFVRQAFLGKIGGLLAVIRRIRFCMQEMVVGPSSSRAQFLMTMETDRRLQMVVMRMRMGR